MRNVRARFSNIILGIFFILIGFGFIGNVFDWWDFDLFFHGWWTFFIIVPCAVSMIRDGIHTWNTIGLLIGVMLLLERLDYIPYGMMWKLIVPVVFVIIGLSILFGGLFSKKKKVTYEYSYDYSANSGTADGNGAGGGAAGNAAGGAAAGNDAGGSQTGTGGYQGTGNEDAYGNYNTDTAGGTNNYQYHNDRQTQHNGTYQGPIPKYNAVFSSQRGSFDNAVFRGASIESVFGSNSLDLRKAVFESNATLYCSAVFGSIEVVVPPGINVRVVQSTFGGVRNLVNTNYEGAPILFINASCALGGITIRV